MQKCAKENLDNILPFSPHAGGKPLDALIK
jgi:hypothetical protein